VFRSLVALCDLAVIVIAWAASYGLRFHWNVLPDPRGAADPEAYVLLGVAMLPLWHLVLRQRGLYEPRRGMSRI
jgi:hypothetical protein